VQLPAEISVGFGQPLAHVDQKQRDVGGRERLLGLCAHPSGKAFGRCLLEPGCIDHAKRQVGHMALGSRRSRVTPGVASTIAACRPTNRLNSVDLPTFGRPIIATVKLIVSLILPADALT